MHVGNVHVAQSMYILSPRQHLENLVMTCTFQSRHAQIEVMSHMHIRNVPSLGLEAKPRTTLGRGFRSEATDLNGLGGQPSLGPGFRSDMDPNKATRPPGMKSQ